jgi:nitrite reductase (NADH) small subunit
MSEYQRIAELKDVPEGRAHTVEVNGRTLAIFRTEEGYAVLDNRCPHKGGPLGIGWVENGKVFCPLHGWEFEIKTGHCVTNPDKPVEYFPSRIVDGYLEALLP